MTEKNGVLSTEASHSLMVADLTKSGADIADGLTAETANLWHLATGVAGEAGELLDAIKKVAIYNRPLDRENAIEELGDIEFYVSGIRAALGVSRDEVLKANITKLQKRYAGGYSDKAAQARADKAEEGDEQWVKILPANVGNLKVGDLVKVEAPQDYAEDFTDEHPDGLRGKIGVVVLVSPTFATVRFSGWKHGHSGAPEVKNYDRASREHWNFMSDEIFLLSKKVTGADDASESDLGRFKVGQNIFIHSGYEGGMFGYLRDGVPLPASLTGTVVRKEKHSMTLWFADWDGGHTTGSYESLRPEGQTGGSCWNFFVRDEEYLTVLG